MNKGDYLTYRKATSISLVGLVMQLLLTLTLFFYGSFARNQGAQTGAIFLGTGLIAWFLLLLIFDLHRRERMEAMEAEQLSASGAIAASAFESAGDELQVAARRLAFVYKWIVPLGSVLMGAINIWFGLNTIRGWAKLASNETFQYSPKLIGFGLAVGIAIAVIGFVFARFVSGMAKEPAWANLRAGSAVSVAAALLGVVLALGGFLELALGIDVVLLQAPYIVGGGMIAFGAEIGLNLLLDIYRPRKPGEDPRPAFDSRFLGLLAAPDRIAENVGDAVNYQFGIDVTSTWFYQLLSRWIMVIIMVGVFIGWMMSTLVVVAPHERGLILTNGRISEPLLSFGDRGEGDVGPGLHVKLPWPFSTYETPVVVNRAGNQEERTTTGVRVLNLAANPPSPGSSPILWTKSHARVEVLNIVQPERDVFEEQLSGSSTSSVNESTSASDVAELSLVSAEVPVHFVVRNVRLFDQFAAPGQRELTLKHIGQRVVTRYLGELAINEIIATHRTKMPEELMQRLNQAYSELNEGQGPGIEILFVGVNGVHPPKKVAPSFERVIIARQNRESVVESALKTETSTLTEVAGSVELAQEINQQLTELDLIRRENGSDSNEYVEAELNIQRLLERAGGEAGELILAAGAERWIRHMSERGQASLLQGQQEAFLAAPELYKSKMYFDALLDAMEISRVYLTPADLESLRVRFDLQDKQVGTDVFDAEAGSAMQ